jgi:mRNA interferase MazF
MVKKPYVPDRGDVIWIDFDPQPGHEQAGRRPALILSPRVYNERGYRLAIACPVTTKAKGSPWEVVLPKSSGAEGVVLSDHVKSIDWGRRRATLIGAAPAKTVGEVADLITTLIG